MKRLLTETIMSDSLGSTPTKFKPSQLLAELQADDDEGPYNSKQRSPTLVESLRSTTRPAQRRGLNFS
jgi:hypothetical protein